MRALCMSLEHEVGLRVLWARFVLARSGRCTSPPLVALTRWNHGLWMPLHQ